MSGGRPLRAIEVAASDVACMVTHAGHVYTAGADGLVWRHPEMGASPPQPFDFGVASAITCLEIEQMARAGWAADGSTARGRPALLLCGTCGGDVRAAELPLRGEAADRRGIAVQSVASGCVVLNTGAAVAAKSSSAAGVAALATVTLAGGLPGAAARAVLGGGGAGVVVVWSLRDGSGCGARMGSPVSAGAPVTALRGLDKSLALVGLQNGSMIVLSGGDGGSSWHVAKEVARCHDGPLRHIRDFSPDERASTLFATAGADGTLRVWQWEGAEPGGEHPAVGLSGGEVFPLGAPLTALTGAHSRASALFGAATDGRVHYWEAHSIVATAVAGTPATPASVTNTASPATAANGAGDTPPSSGGTALRTRTAAVSVHRGAPPSVALPRRGSQS